MSPSSEGPLKVVPLAAESLGTRSMATAVETPDCRILLDPGVSLAPTRHGLAPHPLEIRRMNAHWAAVRRQAARADVLVVTHYHYDHFDPTEPWLFAGKTALLKHPEQAVNASQRQRARAFLRALGRLPREVVFADGGTFRFGETVIRCSPAVPHGPTARLGHVFQVSVRHGRACFLFTSDIQGPCREEAAAFIVAEQPQVLYLDGPLSYLLERGYTRDDLDRANGHLAALAERVRGLRVLILDHHLLRDIRWREQVAPGLAAMETRGVRVVTAAEYLGRPPEALEARRRELFRDDPDPAPEPVHRRPGFALVRALEARTPPVLTLVPALPEDERDLEALLLQAGLPLEGVREHRDTFWVLRERGQAVGCVGLEAYGTAGLLRSLAVAPGFRGRGWGRRLVHHAEVQAQALGIRRLYLLTTTAGAYFQRLGYAPVPRERVDAGVRASVEFRSACPKTAACLVKVLAVDNTRSL